MNQYQYNDIQQNDEYEEEGLDVKALIKGLWDGRKTIIIVTAIFMVMGLIVAFTMKRTYTVSTIMVPQMNSRATSSLSSLASLAGFDFGTSNTSGGDISPLVYPQIVNSVPFCKELIYTPIHYEKVDTAISTYTYMTKYVKPSPISYVLKYTIGLPKLLFSAGNKKYSDIAPQCIPASDDHPQPIILSRAEAKVMKTIAKSISITIEKKEGYISLMVTGSEPLQTAELALKAQTLLQEEVTRFRTEKAQAQLDYIQARYDDIKAEAEYYQSQLATVKDRSQQMTTSRSKIEQERIQNKYNVANSIYGEMAKQLEQAKMQVKRDTPQLTVIQPVTVPNQASNSRSKMLTVWVLLGFAVGCGIALGKKIYPMIKEAISNTDKTEEPTEA